MKVFERTQSGYYSDGTEFIIGIRGNAYEVYEERYTDDYQLVFKGSYIGATNFVIRRYKEVAQSLIG